MRDVDTLLRALDGPGSALPAPAWPEPPRAPRMWVPVLGAAALAAAVAVAVASGSNSDVRLRGAPGRVRVDLRMVVDRGDGALRISNGSTYYVGDRVYFRVAASPGTRLLVWVDGPDGREEIGAVDATDAPADLRAGGGLVAWEFDRPGRYTFSAGAELDTSCEGCDHVTLEVR